MRPPKPNNSLKDFKENCILGMYFTVKKRNTEYIHEYETNCNTMAQTPHPLKATNIEILMEANRDEIDIKDCFLNNNFLIKITRWTIEKALNNKANDITLMMSVKIVSPK